MQQDADAGRPIKHPRIYYTPNVPLSHFQTACLLYDIFKSAKVDYMLRVEGRTIAIFSNDSTWLKTITDKIICKEIWMPDGDEHANTLLQNVNLVTKRGPDDFIYKVYFDDFVDPAFAKFCRSNPDKIKIGDTAIYSVENKHFVRGMYFWAKNDKILNLASLACGCRFKKVLKHVPLINTDAEEKT